MNDDINRTAEITPGHITTTFMSHVDHAPSTITFSVKERDQLHYTSVPFIILRLLVAILDIRLLGSPYC